MASNDQTIWTCDRCGQRASIPTYGKNHERNGMPEGWSHHDARREAAARLGIPRTLDLCTLCTDDFEVWLKDV